MEKRFLRLLVLEMAFLSSFVYEIDFSAPFASRGWRFLRFLSRVDSGEERFRPPSLS